MAGDRRNTGKQKVDPKKKKKRKDLYEPGQYIQRSLQIGDDEDRVARSASATVSGSRGLVDESDSSDDDHVHTPVGMRSSGGDDSATPSTTRRRGDARAHSPSRCTGRKEIFFVGDALIGGAELASFFRPQMKNELDGFYPRWSLVPLENKNRIWELFLKEWNLGEYDPDMVYRKFMSQNVDKYRKFLNELKASQLKEYKVDDVKDLFDKPKSPFIRSDEIWRRYLQHWDSPEQRAKSKINKQNRDKGPGSSHGFGRKSGPARMHEMEVAGEKPSMVKILTEVNKKRDERRNPTGEVHHRDLQAALDEYHEIYAQTKPGVDLEDDYDLWTSTKAVSQRLSKGRVLGGGSCKQAASLFAPTRNVGGSSTAFHAELEEMRRQQEEAQKKHEEDLRRVQEETAEQLRISEAKMLAFMQAMQNQLQSHMPGFVMPSFASTSQVPSPADVVPQTQGAPRQDPI